MRAILGALLSLALSAAALADSTEASPGTLVIGVGEPVDAVAEFADGKLVGWHDAKAGESADATHLKILLKADDRGGMLATIENLGPSDVKLKFEMIPADDEGWVETSSCPVGAGMSNFVSWPHTIAKLRITDARVLQPGEQVACE